MDKLKSIGQMLVQTFKRWSAADPWRQSAIIAYYAIFSIPGLLMIVIWVAGSIFGEQMVEGEVQAQIEDIMGPEAADGVEQLLDNRELEESGFFMKAVGIGALIFGATTLFFQLQKSLNYIWDVEADPENNIKKLLFDRVYSLGLILVIAFLLLITLVLSAAISVVGDWITENFGESFLHLIRVVSFVVSLAIVTVLFGIMYKVLPDAKISWRTVWVGALVTAILFTIGETLLGLYFSYADPGSSFGAAGTVILVMLWVNYTCLILFFGAEFTQVYAHRYGHRIQPSKHAKWRAEVLMNDKDPRNEKRQPVQHRDD